ncbi:MAG TPA: ATP synthase F1 subunit delta [Geobacterales bacterium]|nr:ATP synthase F1 subunit delta [Geobacterales bacterium]
MKTNTIARRYAKALVQLGVEEKGVERFQTELDKAAGVIAGSPELRSVLANPAYAIEQKREILQDLIARLSLSSTVRSFLMLLLDKKRIEQLPQIAQSFGSYVDELGGVVRPTLASPFPLDDRQVEGVRKALEQVTGKKVLLNVEQDASLIGGLVTKIGDMVFDGSVKTQLSMIQDTLQKG